MDGMAIDSGETESDEKADEGAVEGNGAADIDRASETEGMVL